MRRTADVLDRIWSVERSWPGFWKAFAVCVAGVFALWQYFSIQNGIATTHTMDYIKRYEDGPVADARQEISRMLRSYSNQFNRMRLSADQQRKILQTLFDEDPKLYDRVDTIVDFFEGLRTCVKGRVCSENVAVGYFGGEESRQFWHNFLPYIKDRQSNNSDYARGIEWFVTQKPSK
jgi:hypothetical protein